MRSFRILELGGFSRPLSTYLSDPTSGVEISFFPFFKIWSHCSLCLSFVRADQKAGSFDNIKFIFGCYKTLYQKRSDQNNFCNFNVINFTFVRP